MVTLQASATVKANLSRVHLRAAQTFLAGCREIAKSESKLPWPQPHWEEAKSYASGAVILSVAALEASINELYLEALDGSSFGLTAIPSNQQRVLSTLWEEVDEYSILKKYEVALAVCQAPAFDRGDEPYQSAAALIELRNALVHFKPEWGNALDRHAKLRSRLQGRFEDCPLSTKTEGTMVWFPHVCLGVGCAAWSIEATCRLVRDFCVRLGIVNRLPDEGTA